MASYLESDRLLTDCFGLVCRMGWGYESRCPLSELMSRREPLRTERAKDAKTRTKHAVGILALLCASLPFVAFVVQIVLPHARPT
jgi:hypothetical protein